MPRLTRAAAQALSDQEQMKAAELGDLIVEMTLRLLSGQDAGGLDAPALMEARNSLVFFTDSVAALGGSAAFTGTSRDSLGYYSRFRARAFANVAGTLVVEQSLDGTTWRQETSHTQAVGAGETRQLDVPISARFVRVRYVNGAGAQASFELISALAAES